MTKKKTIAEAQPAAKPAEKRVEETPAEAVASILSVLVVGLFILTFLGQNYVIPSGSMEKTLLVGDHLLVDRITLAPATRWMPLVHQREPRRGDIIVFFKPVKDPDQNGNLQYLTLVKRLIGVPGDHIHLSNGVVVINGVPQKLPPDADNSPNPANDDRDFLDNFPASPPPPSSQVPDSWSMVEFPKDVVNGELVVPPGKYFMMGDHRHNSLDSRYWGFVPRENIVGRPLFNYWSFEASEDEISQSNAIAWLGHVALHFFPDTRWSRTFHRVK